MNRRTAIGVLAGFAVLALTVPVALADTCCANTPVSFEPATAMPGDTVRLDGISCLASDNSGPLALNLQGFWLSTDDVPADPDPGDVPGSGLVHLAEDLPPVEDWPAFEIVTGAGRAAAGSATIVVPTLANGSYQLWWWCDNGGGPGSGIHYSGGPRLAVGSTAPDTATVAPAAGAEPVMPHALLPALGMVAGLAVLRRVAEADRRRRAR